MASTNAEKSEPVAPQLRKTSELWEGDAFADLRRQMERVFQDFSKSFGSMPETIFDRGDLLDLRVDVQEADDHYEISAELPGLDQKDVELSIDDRVLTIKGEKKLESEREEKAYRISERRYGSFRRAFRLPDDADQDNIAAKFEKGILAVSVPRLKGAKSNVRKIEIGND